MIDFNKITQDAFIDELEKTALSQKTMESATLEGTKKALRFLEMKPRNIHTMRLANNKLKQSSVIRAGAIKRKLINHFKQLRG
jgi:hypothetical protein